MNNTLRSLKKHIASLKKEHNLNIKWGHSYGVYDSVANIIKVPHIKNYKHYLIVMHEIGHALSDHQMYAKTEMEVLSDKLKVLDLIAFTEMNDKNKLHFLKKLEKLTAEYTSFCKSIYAPKWSWKNEMVAWEYVIQNSIIWDKKCEKFARKSMMSYWIVMGNRNTNMSMTDIYKSYCKFTNKYVNPIFSDNT